MEDRMDKEKININISRHLQEYLEKHNIIQTHFIKEVCEEKKLLGASQLSEMCRGYRNGKGDSFSNYGIESISELCDYLGYSIDGFISDDKPLSPDTELQAVCKYLRLDEEAVIALRDRDIETPPVQEPLDTFFLNELVAHVLPALNQKVMNYWLFCDVHEPRELDAIEKEATSMKKRLSSGEIFPDDKETAGIIEMRLSMSTAMRIGRLYDIQMQVTKHINKLLDFSELEKREAELQKIVGICCEQSISSESKKEGVRDGEHKENKK
jgi:transcriptional regulator with XRE-family HTH domain